MEKKRRSPHETAIHIYLAELGRRGGKRAAQNHDKEWRINRAKKANEASIESRRKAAMDKYLKQMLEEANNE